MTQYVIHIGPPKVGSKYLQTSLAALSEQLLSRGICYPTSLFSDHSQVWHQPLAAQLLQGRSDALERAFEGLNAANHDYVCFSFEGFFGLDDAALSYLRQLCGTSEVRVVYYCRRWSERIHSLWKQNVKEGFVEIFPEYYARAVRSPIHAPDLNPSLVWKRFARIFGRDNLQLVSFNNLLDHKVDMVEHFLRTFFGQTFSVPTTDVFSNESPSVIDTEILRVLNAIHLRKVGRQSDTVRIKFLRHRPNLDVDFIASEMRADLGEIVINDHHQVFGMVYELMLEFCDRLISPQYGTNFFNLTARKCAYVQQNYLLNVRVLRHLHRIYDEIGA